ncbi:hypothetical protein [Calothrix sp. NIES-3974]|uniref:hypothetical protein n=1 Tax=Calothrix sp. NIES-3974 TaxID=2005462 RepID=UPI000BBC779E|nr:hypothetical protein [Calothrix sp. NIES-3974]
MLEVGFLAATQTLEKNPTSHPRQNLVFIPFYFGVDTGREVGKEYVSKLGGIVLAFLSQVKIIEQQ